MSDDAAKCPVCGERIIDWEPAEKVPFDCDECGNELIALKNADGVLEIEWMFRAMESLLQDPEVTDHVVDQLKVSAELAQRAQQVFLQLRDSLLFHQPDSSVEKARAALLDVMKSTLELLRLEKASK